MYRNNFDHETKNPSSILLILGLAFPVIGLSANQTAFSWAAIAVVVLSLLLGPVAAARGAIAGVVLRLPEPYKFVDRVPLTRFLFLIRI